MSLMVMLASRDELLADSVEAITSVALQQNFFFDRLIDRRT